MSGPPPRCVRLRQRLRRPRSPYLDGGRHLPVDSPAFTCDPRVEQVLGNCAGKASVVSLRSRRTGQRAIASQVNGCRMLAVNDDNRYGV